MNSPAESLWEAGPPAKYGAVDGDQVQFLGELGAAEKTRLLGQALATVVPTALPEPFGLVTLESMAYGTPVIATETGAVQELVVDG